MGKATSVLGPLGWAWRVRARHRGASIGWGVRIRGLLGFLVALGLAIPIVDSLFLGWIEGPVAARPDAMRALLTRSGLLVVGWIALDTYSVLIRDGDREILSIWPFDPRDVALYEVARLAVGKAWMLLAAGVLLFPLWMLDPVLWGLALVHTGSVAVLALASSAMVVLLAVDASDNPAVRPLLDLVRGNNHPAQAAFIYAPGLVLALAGVFAWWAADGAARVVAGDLAGVGLLLLPMLPAMACAAAVPTLARRNWFRAGQVMAEVDARYAMLEDQEERLGVYLDWSVRFLPTRVALYALRDLRHGWRQHRAWITGAWLVGLAALAASWTSDPTGPGRTALVTSVGCWWLAAVALRLAADEPEFLRAWLPAEPFEQRAARVFVLMAWQQPVLWMGMLGTLVSAGFEGAALVALVGGVSTALASTTAAMLSTRGWAVYGPVAAVGVLGLATGVLG